MTTDGWPSAAERAELATVTSSTYVGTIAVPVGSAYTADDTGGRTLSDVTSWRTVPAGVRPLRQPTDRRPAGESNRHRRQWAAITAPDVDLLAGNAGRVVALATLAELTAALGAGDLSTVPLATIVAGPLTGELGTSTRWDLEETDRLP